MARDLSKLIPEKEQRTWTDPFTLRDRFNLEIGEVNLFYHMNNYNLTQNQVVAWMISCILKDYIGEGDVIECREGIPELQDTKEKVMSFLEYLL